MTAFFACLLALVVSMFILWRFFVRPLQRDIVELRKIVEAESIWSTGQYRLRCDEVKALRKLSGKELEAVSERLYKVEDRETVKCAMN